MTVTIHRKVFIVGCVRSGTSWVRSIFMHHPLTITTTESHAFYEVYVPVAVQNQPWEVLLENFDRSIETDNPVGIAKWIDRTTFVDLIEQARLATDQGASRVEAAVQIIRGVIDRHAADHHATPDHLIAEKTPNHIFFADVILDHFPEAKIIEVVRDGRDVCVSMQQRALVAAWSPADRSAQITRWVDAVRHGMTLRANPAYRDRWQVVHYEAMKRDPTEEISRVLSFLDLPRSPEIVARLVEDTSFHRLPGTGEGMHQRKGEVGDWRNHFSAEDNSLFREMAGELFAAAGYQY